MRVFAERPLARRVHRLASMYRLVDDDRPASLVLSIVFVAIAATACGEPDVVSLEARADLRPGAEGRTLRLVRRSTRCGVRRSAPIEAHVAAGAEFSAERVGDLESPCGDSPSPAIDVHVEATSAIFDFSGVDSSGSFPEARFEGYSLYFARSCPDMALESADVDTQHSTVMLSDGDVRTHYDRLDVNFAGRSYDPESFLKVDLSYVEVHCMGEP